MASDIQKDLSEAETLEELYPVLDALNISSGWHKPEPSLWDEPRHVIGAGERRRGDGLVSAP